MFDNNKKNGYGELYFVNDSIYKGWFANDEANGEGMIVEKSNFNIEMVTFCGIWKHNKLMTSYWLYSMMVLSHVF